MGSNLVHAADVIRVCVGEDDPFDLATAGSGDRFFEHGHVLVVPRSGIEKKAWPHNAYIFVLHTLGGLGLLAFLLLRLRILILSLMYREPAVRDGPLGTMMGIFHVLLIVNALAMM